MLLATLLMDEELRHQHETVSPEMTARARNDVAEASFALARFNSTQKSADYWDAVRWLENALESLRVPHVRSS